MFHILVVELTYKHTSRQQCRTNQLGLENTMLPGAREPNKMREMGWLGKKPSRWNTPTSILANWDYINVKPNIATSFKVLKRPKIPKF